MTRQLKSVATEASQPPVQPAPVNRPDAAALRRVATEAGRSLPPAVLAHRRKTVLINVKVSQDLAFALVDRAEREGITQKQVITRALAAAGLPVDALDLEDRSARRRGRAGP